MVGPRGTRPYYFWTSGRALGRRLRALAERAYQSACTSPAAPWLRPCPQSCFARQLFPDRPWRCAKRGVVSVGPDAAARRHLLSSPPPRGSIGPPPPAKDAKPHLSELAFPGRRWQQWRLRTEASCTGTGARPDHPAARPWPGLPLRVPPRREIAMAVGAVAAPRERQDAKSVDAQARAAGSAHNATHLCSPNRPGCGRRGTVSSTCPIRRRPPGTRPRRSCRRRAPCCRNQAAAMSCGASSTCRRKCGRCDATIAPTLGTRPRRRREDCPSNTNAPCVPRVPCASVWVPLPAVVLWGRGGAKRRWRPPMPVRVSVGARATGAAARHTRIRAHAHAVPCG